MGPGLITGASDDDPSGIATYSQAGAQFGYSLGWTLLLTYPLMCAIQMISAQVGRVTGKGLAGNLRSHYPAPLVYPLIALLLVANIINIGADSVRNGLWDHAAYNAAKGGVHALATGLAREFATDGITVNVVAPCIVNTPQVQQAALKAPQAIQRFIDVVPMGRAGEMDEIASMVCYLASKEASFVTGQVISVNGGSTML